MPAPAERYNVLFIISDEHHRRVLGCYGNKLVQTPHIDRLAREGAGRRPEPAGSR